MEISKRYPFLSLFVSLPCQLLCCLCLMDHCSSLDWEAPVPTVQLISLKVVPAWGETNSQLKWSELSVLSCLRWGLLMWDSIRDIWLLGDECGLREDFASVYIHGVPQGSVLGPIVIPLLPKAMGGDGEFSRLFRVSVPMWIVVEFPHLEYFVHSCFAIKMDHLGCEWKYLCRSSSILFVRKER